MKSLDPYLNRITNGDCFELMRNLPDGSVDLVLTDPPYGIDYQSNRRVAREKLPKFANDVDLGWVDGWVEEVFRVLKEDTHFYCFTRFDMYPRFYDAISRLFKVKNCLIWVKNNHGSGDLNGSFAPQHEMIIFAAKGKRHLNGPRDSDVLDCDNVPSAHRHHATQKPVELLRQLIEKSTEPEQIVLDPFAGVGSTGLACLDMHRTHGDHQERSYVLFELNPDFVESARRTLGHQEVLISVPKQARVEPHKSRPTLRTNRVRARKDQTLPLPF
jgi:site-specific DNA-methyltransferase (adenine-specific)